MKTVPTMEHGPRPISEFHFGGLDIEQPANGCTSYEWASFLYFNHDPELLSSELWFHMPSNSWYRVLRNLMEDRFIEVVLFDNSLVRS